MRILKLGVFVVLLAGIYQWFLILPVEWVWLHIVTTLFASFVLSTVLFSLFKLKRHE